MSPTAPERESPGGSHRGCHHQQGSEAESGQVQMDHLAENIDLSA